MASPCGERHLGTAPVRGRPVPVWPEPVSAELYHVDMLSGWSAALAFQCPQSAHRKFRVGRALE